MANRSAFIIKHNTIRTALSFVIVFMLVFAFPIGNISSSKIAILIAMLLLIGQPNLWLNVLSTFKNKNLFFFLSIILLFSIYTLVLTIIKGESDFSLFLKEISALIFILSIFLIYSIIRKENIPKLIIIAIIVQSVLITLSILSQEFYDFTSYFRKEISENHLASYGRLRGNAFSGYQFFGIGVMYGFVIIYYFVKKDLSKFRHIITLIFIIIIGFISSRFTAFATLTGFIIWFFIKSRLKIKKWVVISGLLTVIFSFFSLSYIYHNELNEKTVRVINYQIKMPIENFINTGKLHTSSSEFMNKMYSKSQFKNIIFGDGRYMSISGNKYYKSVDTGYLRMMFYYGISGLIVLVLIQFIFFFHLSYNSSKENLLAISFFIFFIIANYKGDVFFYSNNTLPIIIGILYFQNEKQIPRN